MTDKTPVTRGTHHIGLTVSKLEQSAAFFVDILGWKEVRRDNDYPAIFVSDGVIMLTLWAAKSHKPIAFDKNDNVGLHHLALLVDDFDSLDRLHNRLKNRDIKIEFPPEPLRGGPTKHMMCYEPSGIRVEFICVPN